MSSWLLLIIAILTVFLLKYIRVLYLVFKLPAPSFMVLFINIGSYVIKQKDFYSTLTNIINSSPPVFRLILGPYINIVTLRPQDAEIICATCLEKGSIYGIVKDMMGGDSILVASPQKSQKNRKLVNNSFSKKVVNSFADVFTKQAKVLGTHIEGEYGKKSKDLMVTMWSYTLGTIFEILADVQLNDVLIKKMLSIIEKSEKIILERVNSPWLNIKAIWNKSSYCNELTTMLKATEELIQKEIIDAVKNDPAPTDSFKKRFLNNLFEACKKVLISNENILTETKLMIAAASETAASTLSFAFIALGIYPEIQDMVYEEIISALDDSDELSFEVIKQLQYLERVIKETLRLKPAIPYIARKLHKDIFCDPFTFPAGCDVLIPIDQIHINPKVWKDPLKFDPDRFLPEEVKTRHRCAYIPFSHGLRNCLGAKYAMLSLKCTIAEIVKNYRIVTLYPKELADVKVDFTIVAIPQNYSTEFIKRQ